MALAPGLRVRTWHLVAVGVIAVGAVVAALALSGWGPLGSQHATLVSAHKASTTESLNPAGALGVNTEDSATPEPSASASSSTTSGEMDESSTSSETESDDTGDDDMMQASPTVTPTAEPTETPEPTTSATAMPSASPTPHDE